MPFKGTHFVYDGKTFDFAKAFPYQSVSTDCQVLVFDDVKNYFENELSQFVGMLSRFTVKAPFDTVKVFYFRPE